MDRSLTFSEVDDRPYRVHGHGVVAANVALAVQYLHAPFDTGTGQGGLASVVSGISTMTIMDEINKKRMSRETPFRQGVEEPPSVICDTTPGDGILFKVVRALLSHWS